jgi:hypothetical protein
MALAGAGPATGRSADAVCRWLELIERNLLALAQQIKTVGRQRPLFFEYRLALMKAEEQFVAGLVRRMDMACKKNSGEATKGNVVELGTNIQKAIPDKLIETFDDVVQQPQRTEKDGTAKGAPGTPPSVSILDEPRVCL